MRILPIAFVFAVVVGATANAAPANCTMESSTNQIQIDQIQRAGRSAKVQLQLLDGLKTINAKATDSRRKLEEQLSPKDAARFAELSEKLKSLQLASYVESEHARDADLVRRMFEAARKAYANPQFTPERSDIPGSFVMAMRIIFPNDSQWSQPAGTCSVDVAIGREQAATFNRITQMDPLLTRGNQVIDKMRAKYRLGQGEKLDPAKMTPEDARTIEVLMVQLEPAFREQTLATDLRNIRSWWEIADLVYNSWKEDVSTYGGFEHLGDTLDASMKGANQQQQVMLGLWKKLDQLVKSDAQLEMEQAAAAAAAAH